nr:MAG TPA: hypothetical protein [Herelleviridae sp.]
MNGYPVSVSPVNAYRDELVISTVSRGLWEVSTSVTFYVTGINSKFLVSIWIRTTATFVVFCYCSWQSD